MLAVVMVCFASCLSSDELDVTYYNDAAITNFYITSADVEYHTTSSKGEDSTYIKANTDVASIKFRIDHYNGKIYNVDSLPYGTDAKKLLCSYSVKSNGMVGIRSLENDTVWNYLTTTDSLDFTNPRVVRVFAYNDRQLTRDYTVEVNVKKVSDDSGIWVKKNNVTLPQWVMDDNAVGYGNAMAAINGGRLTYTNADGVTTEEYSAEGIAKLLAMNTQELYAYSADNKVMVSRDHGATWTADTFDETLDAQPVAALSVHRLGVSGVFHTVMLADPQTDDADRKLQTWMKTIIDGNGQWIGQTGDREYNLPVLGEITLAAANSGMFFVTGRDNETGEYEDIYVSRDGGLTWKADSQYELPDAVKGQNKVVLHVTDGGYLVAVCNGEYWTLKL